MENLEQAAAGRDNQDSDMGGTDDEGSSKKGSDSGNSSQKNSKGGSAMKSSGMSGADSQDEEESESEQDNMESEGQDDLHDLPEEGEVREELMRAITDEYREYQTLNQSNQDLQTRIIKNDNNQRDTDMKTE